MGCLIPFNLTHDKVFDQYYLVYTVNIEIRQAYETLSILVNFIIFRDAIKWYILLVALPF